MSPPLRRRPPTADIPAPEQFAAEFGCRKPLARRCVLMMLAALCDGQSPYPQSSLQRWKSLIDHACGRDVGQRSPAMVRLAEAYGLPPQSVHPAELLFSVQTYYALLVRLLLDQVLPGIDGNRLFENDPLDWCTRVEHAQLSPVIGELADRVAGCAPSLANGHGIESSDWFKPLYQNLFPGAVRHALGEYYTPRWLAEHVLEQVGYTGLKDGRLLDPACGSGTFLLAAIDRIRRHASCQGKELLEKILSGVVGFDLNPVAVLSARANYLMAVADLIQCLPHLKIPVLLRDSICDATACDIEDGWDVVVGNPPWVAWDSLPQEYRSRTKPLWQRYGLFSLSAGEARHGGAKKDLAMLVLYVAADRYLRDGGRLGMVITQTAFQSKGAGDGFRRFRLGTDGPPLRVLRVDDLTRFQPFADASNWTATVAIEKGHPTTYPVPYIQWSLTVGLPEENGHPSTGAFRQRICRARPVDPQRPSSPWMILPQELTVSPDRLIGPSDYRAHLGANSGGANGVYWVEILETVDGGVRIRNMAGHGKRALPQVEQVVEPDLLYPLLRWGDVDRFTALPRAHLLVTQDAGRRRGIDPKQFAERYPRTLAYLEQFESLLRSRSAYRRYQQEGPYWSMYNVGPYTLAPYKVVWRRMDRQIRAAVVESLDDPLLGRRPVVPQETCVLIAAESSDEAHYLCGLLNSVVVDFLVHSHNVRGGKGFGTPGMLERLRLRQFNLHDRRHALLAAAARQAQTSAQSGLPSAAVQQEIDHLVGQLWDLTSQEIERLQKDNINSETGPR